MKLSSKLSPPLLHSYSMPFIRGHPIQKSMLKVCRTVHFFPGNQIELVFLTLTTCSWEMSDIHALLKGNRGSFAPLLSDVAGLQP